LNLQIEEARRNIRERLEIIELMEIRAPADGYVNRTPFSTGSYVTTTRNVVAFTENSGVFVEFLGSTIENTWLEASRLEARINGQTYAIRYTPMVDDPLEMALMRITGRRIDWRFEILTDGDLPPLGSYATMLFYIVDIPDALRIPINAVQFTPAVGNHVFRMEGDEAVMVPVRLTRAVNWSDTYAEVLEGLEEGDEVIVFNNVVR
jgi:multidrug efflux pump subunit AcrA (membrane-fusion protein)